MRYSYNLDSLKTIRQ